MFERKEQDRKKILLVEFKFHQEIIPTQLEFLLSAGFEVFVAIHAPLWDKALFSPYHARVHFVPLKQTRGFWARLRSLLTIKRLVQREKIDVIILNTLETTSWYFLMKMLPRVSTFGIAHRVQRVVKEPILKRNLAMVKGVLTLSDHTLDFLSKSLSRPDRATSFYPIFFNRQVPKSVRTERMLQVVIPGMITFKKRDYEGLLHAVRSARQKLNVRFHLLANIHSTDGEKLLKLIHEAGVADNFVIYEKYVPYESFLEVVAKCDLVMPLLGPAVENYENYLNSQISASFNWAYAFKKPLLIHRDLQHTCIRGYPLYTYGDDTLLTRLEELSEKAELPATTPEYLSFENQRERYLNLIAI